MGDQATKISMLEIRSADFHSPSSQDIRHSEPSSDSFCLLVSPIADWLLRIQKRSLLLGGVFAICLLLICGGIIYSDYGSMHIRNYGHDVFFQIDNSWRIVAGQRPHVDYSSGWGVLALLFHAFGFWLAGNNPSGLRYGDAIWGLLIGVWSYVLLTRRMQMWAALASSITLTLMITAPIVMGDAYTRTSHAMGYNREGYAVFGLILLEILQPPRKRQRDRAEFIDGLSTGAALGVLLFLKANFFAVGAILLVSSFVLIRQTRQRFQGLAIGFALVAIGALAYLRFDVLAMWRDYRIAAGARQDLLFHTAKLSLEGNLPLVFPFLLLFFVAALALPNGSVLWRRTGMILQSRLLWLGIGVIVIDLALGTANTQKPALPMCGLFAVIILNEVIEHFQGLSGQARISFLPFGATLAVLASLLAFHLPLRDAASLIYACIEKNQTADAYQIDSPRFSHVYFHDIEQPTSNNGRQYVDYVNDGLALLRKNTTDADSVLAIDLFDPFPYLLGRKPVNGGSSVLAYGYLLTNQFRPSDANLIGDATTIMVPKQSASIGRLQQLFKPILKHYYTLDGESRSWLLYKRVR